YVEGQATLEELGTAYEPAFDVVSEFDVSAGAPEANTLAAFAVSVACRISELAEVVASNASEAAHVAGIPDEVVAQVALVRDIFGNPFRPVVCDPAWRTSDVLLMAQGIYDDRAFDRMPILADALQDAGCDNADVLNHCREANATHVRGCWVVDLVLGKT